MRDFKYARPKARASVPPSVAGIGILVFALFCSAGAASSDEYNIVNTGAKVGGCWYDDTHFVVLKGQQPPHSQTFVVKGLYYLNLEQPNDLRPIDLSPLEPSVHEQIGDISCQNQTLVFSLLRTDNHAMRAYTLILGQAPELLAEIRGTSALAVSLKGKYILAHKFSREKVGWEEHPDCGIRHESGVHIS